MCTYIALTCCGIVAWNIGAPRLGVPGRIPELLGLEKEYLDLSLANKLARFQTWLNTCRIEARGFAQMEAPRLDLDLLATAKKSPDPELDAAKRNLAARYDAVRAAPLSRILIIRQRDGLVLIDSEGRAMGSTYPFTHSQGQSDSGQFRDSGELHSYCVARSASGVPIIFLLAAPLAPILGELREDRFDEAKGVGFALLDEGGKLIYPFAVPGSKSRLAVGESFIDKDRLAYIADKGEPTLIKVGTASLSIDVAKMGISTEEALYPVTVIARSATLGRIAKDSAAMAILFLLMAATTSLLAHRYIIGVLSPLGRLHDAVEAFGRSEAEALPENAPGEVGEITRAFSGLMKRVNAWKSELEAEVETRTRTLKLTTELCGIYASDPSENASLKVVNILKASLGADAVAVFYVKARDEYRYYLAGSEAPTTLAEELWHDCASRHRGQAELARFGPWAPPGIDLPLESWLSFQLLAAKPAGRFLFLGKAKGSWSEEEEANYATVARTIAPIVRVRREREIEELIRREAEEKLFDNERRLRTFLEGSHDMIYTADSQDLVTGINAAGLSLLGRSKKAEIIGMPFSSFALNPDDRRQLLGRIGEVGYAADYEIVLKRGDGNSVFCLETAYAIRDPEGVVIELQGIVKDITDRIRSESALWKSNVELADANLKIQRAQSLMVQHEKLASIGQLAAGVAHEINNPLGFLKSNHEMLEKYLRTIKDSWEEAKVSPAPDFASIERRHDLAYLFPEIDMLLHESDEGFARIMNIVSNLKVFSRIEQGADFKPYDVNAGIESTLVVARNEIKYVANVRKDLGELPQILAKGSEINQVILNILVNAAQAIEGQKREEKGLIDIYTIAKGDQVVIGIRDDGPGIPDAIRMKIFDPFFTTKEPGKGTGLGLSISYDIVVSHHGGRLGADSTPGLGTAFTIELPISGPSKEGGFAQDGDGFPR